jgi:hypothetical protein
MRRVAVVATLATIVFLVTAAGTPQPSEGIMITTFLAPGQPFCPTRMVTAGTVTMPSGRCFSIVLMRPSATTFFAFAPAEAVRMRPGQVVPLHAPLGARIVKTVIVVVPIPVTVVVVPISTIGVGAMQVIDDGSTLRVGLAGAPATVVTLTP